VATKRKFVAVFAGDVVGYSRLMGSDEGGTLAEIRSFRRTLVDRRINENHGRFVKTMGDGILVEFASGLDAVRCAVDIQRQMMEWNADLPSDKRVEFRIGINMGDVIIADNGDIFGDVVNVAARLEGIAEPGGICVSGRVKEDVEGKLDVLFEDNGEQRQEYRNRSASLSGADQGRYTNTGASRSRQAVDCGFAFREPKRGSAAGIFRRWHGGRHHHRAIAHSLALRHRPQFQLCLQRQSDRC
jgi:class 3 adenylate cyclase